MYQLIQVRPSLWQGILKLCLFFRPGLEQVFYVITGQAWGRFLASTWHNFVKFSNIGAKRTCIDIRRVVVKLSGLISNAIQHGQLT